MKFNITVKTKRIKKRIKTGWSLEMADDLKAFYGI